MPDDEAARAADERLINDGLLTMRTAIELAILEGDDRVDPLGRSPQARIDAIDDLLTRRGL